jgi:broad specificity phosphatase PhoE
MKPKRIILIRHGESQANVNKTLYGSIHDSTDRYATPDQSTSCSQQLSQNLNVIFYGNE